MDGLLLRHLENILYRKDELTERIALLHMWTVRGDIDLFGFEHLIKQCNKEDVERGIKRRSGCNIS